jgi:membrane fusion protein (multidrug efflux system)
MRYVLALVGLLLVVGALAFVKFSQISMLIGMGEAMAKVGPPPEAVSTAPAELQTWEASLRAVGTVASAKGVEISSEVPGVVKKIGFESGALVKKGDVLVVLDSRVERAQLSSAQVRRDLALTTVKRARTLGAAGAESQAQLDADENALSQATAELEVLRAQIARKTIRAPFAGRLGIRAVNLGQYLDPGTSITTLEAVGGAYVDFELPQRYQPDVAVGLPVRVEAEGMPELAAKGTITAISPTVDPTTRTLELRAEVEHDEGKLQPGMFVRVEVVLPEERRVVAVPLTAVVYAPYGDSVFVVEDPAEAPDLPASQGPSGEPVLNARQQFVRLGERRGDFGAVLDGVQPGQVLVSAGAFKLRNNSPVFVNDELAPKPELDPNPRNR